MKKLIFTIIVLISVYASQASCVANLTDTPVSGRTIRFTNSTYVTAAPHVSYSFTLYYGNGVSTSFPLGANVSYTYPGTATSYYATLMEIRTDSSTTPVSYCYDSVSLAITVSSGAPPANQITGSIHIDSTSPNPAAAQYQIWLIKYDSTANTLTAVDSQLNTATHFIGSYTFSSEPAGSYRVKAALLNGPTSGTGPVPTYGLNNVHWSGATVVNHGTGTDVQNIIMSNGTVTSGPGFVGGNIGSGANKGTGSNGTPVAKVTVFLMDYTNHVAASTTTDALGNYSFSVPYDIYSIYPEVLGYATTPWTNIVVSANSNSTINFTEHTLSKTVTPHTTGVATLSLNDQVAIFPNPSKGIVNINLPEAATVAITDIVGHKVLSTSANQGTNSLNLASFEAGIYFISIKSDNINLTSKVVLQ